VCFLFINGYLEYPYSQTAYAASQARVGWEPIRIERLMPDGQWKIIVPDAGAMGGMDRTMTVELTGLVGGPECRLRLSSNLEIYYDQFFWPSRGPRPGEDPYAADVRSGSALRGIRARRSLRMAVSRSSMIMT